jgi:hypothetical protein
MLPYAEKLYLAGWKMFSANEVCYLLAGWLDDNPIRPCMHPFSCTLVTVPAHWPNYQ